MAVHPAILRRRINGLGWADKTGRAEYAWDFTNNQARWNSASVGALANTPNWTFSRASTGYVQTSAGVLVPFASGELRRTDKGVLIEGARTNLFTYSQAFDNAAWTKTRASVTANAATAPDGTTTADKLVEDGTASNTHYTYQNITIATSTAYSVSIYAKAGERSQFELRFGDTFGANAIRVQVDLAAGTLSNGGAVGSGYTYASSTITALSAGWYRITLNGTSAATTSGQILAFLLAGGVSVYNGDGTSGLYLWGAQLEAASFPSSYIPTTTASATRAADRLTVTGVTGLDYPLTLFAEFEFSGADSTISPNGRAVLGIHQGSSAERAQLYNISSAVGGVVQDGGVTQAAPTVAGTVAVGVVTRLAMRAAAANFIAAKGGTLSSLTSSGTIPAAPDTIGLGMQASASGQLFGYLRRAAIYASAKTDAQLQAMTT